MHAVKRRTRSNVDSPSVVSTMTVRRGCPARRIYVQRTRVVHYIIIITHTIRKKEREQLYRVMAYRRRSLSASGADFCAEY